MLCAKLQQVIPLLMDHLAQVGLNRNCMWGGTELLLPATTFLFPDIGSQRGPCIREYRYFPRSEKPSPDTCLNQVPSKEGNTSTLQSWEKHVLAALLRHQPENRQRGNPPTPAAVSFHFPRWRLTFLKNGRQWFPCSVLSTRNPPIQPPEAGSSSSEQQ